MIVTNHKNCFCRTCGRSFHYLGITRHRAMHRDKKEDCAITFSSGMTYKYEYSKAVKDKESDNGK